MTANANDVDQCGAQESNSYILDERSLSFGTVAIDSIVYAGHRVLSIF